MELLGLCLAFGFVTALVAAGKGRNAVGYFFLGALLPIVGLIIALVVKRDDGTLEERELASGAKRKCTSCGELVRPEASVCRHCGRELGPAGGDPDVERSLAASALQERNSRR